MHEVKAKGILSSGNGINVYRGCLHGCIYCDSRSLCYQFTHDFEDIEVKINAPQLLETALKSKRKKCMVGTGAMTDPYIPIERDYRLTRRCLEIIDEYGFGLAIQTKSARILDDLKLLKSINSKAKCVVQITMTTYDEKLCKIIEPNVSTTRERFEVLKVMQENNIPTICWFTPILPYINDKEENIRGIMDYCVKAGVHGVVFAGIGMTLRAGDREYYYQKLDKYFPGLKERYIKEFGNAYEVVSRNNRELSKIVYDTCKRHNMLVGWDPCFDYLHKFEAKGEGVQLSFDF